MTIIERLYQYMDFRGLSAYEVEHACSISNGYLGKQRKKQGAVGTDILERIKTQYPELSIIWLFSGRGNMLIDASLPPEEQLAYEMNEEKAAYLTSKDEIIALLGAQVILLEKALSDKQKLITLLEKETERKKP